MGIIFWLLTTIAGYFALVLIAGALTTGMYMLAEVAEENPSAAGKVIKNSIIVVSILHVVLWVDGIPYFETLVGLLCQASYYYVFSKFPFIEIISVRAGVAIVAVVAAHYFWFQYFVRLQEPLDMLQLFGFFIFFVWSIPCALIVSLSINDNVLPGIGPSNPYGTGLHGDGGNSGGGKKRNMFKILADFLYDSFLSGVTAITPLLGQLSSTIGGKQPSGKKAY